MKIIASFEICKKNLYSVQFDHSDMDEFSLAFDKWSDVEYLDKFFHEHSADLTNGFYKDQYGDVTIEEAISITLEEAELLEERLRQIAEKEDSREDLQSIFKPLNDSDYRQPALQKSKATGGYRKSWLRIYAIRISSNFYVVFGSAIKLTETMNDREHLKAELVKLEMTKNYLRAQGVLDKADYELLEL